MFNLMNKRLNKKGFTLIELIVVIAIIAILAVILLPRFAGFTKDANEKAAVSDARNLLLAVQALQTKGVGATEEIDMTDINAYLGYTSGGLGGTLASGAIVGPTDGTFDYVAENGYKVTITNYEIGTVTEP